MWYPVAMIVGTVLSLGVTVVAFVLGDFELGLLGLLLAGQFSLQGQVGLMDQRVQELTDDLS